MRTASNQIQKGRDLTQFYDKSPYTSRNVKRKSDNTNNATRKFDYTAVANRLRTVSWSNYGHPSSFFMNIEKGYPFLKSLKPIDVFDLYIYRNDKQSESLLKITTVRGFKSNLHQGCNNVLPFKSLSQRKPCKIVHKQGWPILIIFGGLEGLSTSISNILYFLSEIQNGRRTGRHLDFPILGLKCHSKYKKIDTFYAVIFL